MSERIFGTPQYDFKVLLLWLWDVNCGNTVDGTHYIKVLILPINKGRMSAKEIIQAI